MEEIRGAIMRLVAQLENGAVFLVTGGEPMTDNALRMAILCEKGLAVAEPVSALRTLKRHGYSAPEEPYIVAIRQHKDRRRTSAEPSMLVAQELELRE